MVIQQNELIYYNRDGKIPIYNGYEEALGDVPIFDAYRTPILHATP